MALAVSTPYVCAAKGGFPFPKKPTTPFAQAVFALAEEAWSKAEKKNLVGDTAEGTQLKPVAVLLTFRWAREESEAKLVHLDTDYFILPDGVEKWAYGYGSEGGRSSMALMRATPNVYNNAALWSGLGIPLAKVPSCELAFIEPNTAASLPRPIRLEVEAARAARKTACKEMARLVKIKPQDDSWDWVPPSINFLVIVVQKNDTFSALFAYPKFSADGKASIDEALNVRELPQ